MTRHIISFVTLVRQGEQPREGFFLLVNLVEDQIGGTTVCLKSQFSFAWGHPNVDVDEVEWFMTQHICWFFYSYKRRAANLLTSSTDCSCYKATFRFSWTCFEMEIDCKTKLVVGNSPALISAQLGVDNLLEARTDLIDKDIAKNTFCILAGVETNAVHILEHLVRILQDGNNELKAAAAHVLWDLFSPGTSSRFLLLESRGSCKFSDDQLQRDGILQVIDDPVFESMKARLAQIRASHGHMHRSMRRMSVEELIEDPNHALVRTHGFHLAKSQLLMQLNSWNCACSSVCEVRSYKAITYLQRILTSRVQLTFPSGKGMDLGKRKGTSNSPTIDKGVESCSFLLVCNDSSQVACEDLEKVAG
ncbi:hypothetical protein ACFE04_000610 [Oxalis oulophora]